MSLRYVHKITEKVKVHGKGAVLLKPNKTSTNKYQICNFTSSRSNQICTEKKSNHDTAQSNTNTTNQISPNNNPIGISILQPDIVKLIVQASFVTRIAAACIYATFQHAYISTTKDKTDKVARTK